MELQEDCKLTSESLQAPALDTNPKETWDHEFLGSKSFKQAVRGQTDRGQQIRKL